MQTGALQPTPDSRVAPLGKRDSYLMRTVNTNLRHRSQALQADESIAFFCECASHHCYSPVWKSSDDFDAMTAEAPGWLLHEGHEPSELWHQREPLPTRTSLRAGVAAGAQQIERQRRLGSRTAAPLSRAVSI
jgi:hypothetical protein